MRNRFVISVSMLGMLSACFGEPNQAALSSIDASKVCMDGGGILDLSNGECTCPGGVTWDGSACEGTNVAAPNPAEAPSRDDVVATDVIPEEHKAVYATLPKEVKVSEDRENDSALIGPPKPQATVEKGPQGGVSSVLTATSTAASTATHTAVSTSTHVESNPSISATSALKAPEDPKAHRDHKVEKKTETPAPGSSLSANKADKKSASSAVKEPNALKPNQRSICEKRGNKGTWDKVRSRCNCSSGYIWHQDQCRVQSGMTSRQVCTSDFNRGKWDSSLKKCACPVGTLWLDQKCQPFASVGESSACESEANRGRWILASRSCKCPSDKTWNRKVKACR